MKKPEWNRECIGELMRRLERLRGIDPFGLSEETLREDIKCILHGTVAVSLNLPKDATWYRVRKLDEGVERYNEYHEIIHRSVDDTMRGRANLPNQPMLYASRNMLVALNEMSVAPDEHVQVLAFRVRKNADALKAFAIGDVEAIHNSGRSNHLGRSGVDKYEREMRKDLWRSLSSLLVDSAFRELFEKKQNESMDYIVTSNIADLMLLGSGHDSFLYPSVRRNLGTNIAIQASAFADKCEMVYSAIERADYVGLGYYAKTEFLEFSREVDESGKFVWLKPPFDKYMRDFKFTLSSGLTVE